MFLILWYASLCFSGAFSQANFTSKLQSYGNYNNVLYFINKVGLTDQLLNAPGLTLFLPSDEALANQPPGYVSGLVHDLPRLKKVLEYHIVLDKVKPFDRNNDNRLLTSMSNQTIRLNYNPRDILSDKMTAQGVKMVNGYINVKIENGFFCGLNGFMIPPEGTITDIVSSRPDLTTLASLVNLAGISGVFNRQNRTLFAPTDAAFAKLTPEVMEYLKNSTGNKRVLTDILEFHLTHGKTMYSIRFGAYNYIRTEDRQRDNILLLKDPSNGEFFVNNALISKTDISATNGVIHLIDDVLINPASVVSLERHGVNLG